MIRELAREILDQLSIRPSSHGERSVPTDQGGIDHGDLRKAIELKIKEMLSKCQLVAQEEFDLQAKEFDKLKKRTINLEETLKLYEAALTEKVGDLDEFWRPTFPKLKLTQSLNSLEY